MALTVCRSKTLAAHTALRVMVWLSMLIPQLAAATFDWNLPVGFPTPKVPASNPISVEKVALGRFLFYDPRLSGNLTQSCASCHRQELAFTDGLPRAVGSTGEIHPRNSLSLTNTAYASSLTWASNILLELEQQAPVPMFGEFPVELGLAGKDEELLDRLQADARYRRLFAEAYPGDGEPITIANVIRAVTSFARTLISGNSPYDRFVQGIDDFALTPSAVRGVRMFGSELLECTHCHPGDLNFTNNRTFQGQTMDDSTFENIGLYNIDGRGAYPANNTGLFELTRVPEDMGKFKNPTLRNIQLTGPYMHDGSIATLEEVLDLYEAGGRTIVDGPHAGVGSDNPFKSGFVRGFELTPEQREDVLNFLKSLTDPEFVTNPRQANPFTSDDCAADCNLDRAVAPHELAHSIDVALERSTLGSCIAADHNDDGAVTIEELTAATVNASTSCPALIEDSQFVIGSTQPAGGGALAVTSGLTRQLTLPLAQCVGGSGAECAGGTRVFRLAGPGFEPLAEPRRRLFPLPDGTTLTLTIHTGITPGARLTIDDVPLADLGDSLVLGTTPAFHRAAVWEFAIPAAQPVPHQVTVWFKLTTEPDDGRASEPIAVILKPRMPASPPASE